MMKTWSFDLLVKANEADGKKIVEGVASTTDPDLQKERVTMDALKEMARDAIGLPLTSSHSNELADEIGEITGADIIGDKLHIRAELFEDDPTALKAWKSIRDRRRKVGFSIGGHVIAKRRAINEPGVDTILDSVKLNHVFLTKYPANPATLGTAIAKAMTEAEEDLYKSDISADDRDKYATYHENGEGKFPIRPGNTHDAESALHLIGHAPENQQDAIKKRACAILGDEHPACKEFHDTNKAVNTMTDTEKEALEKAGAKFSADTKSQLKDIHDAGSDEVKSKVRAMLGDDADAVLSANTQTNDDMSDEAKDGDGDDDGDNAHAANDATGGVGPANKSLAITKEDVTAIVHEAIREALKSTTTLKGNPNVTAAKTQEQEDALKELGKQFRRYISL